MYVDLLGRSMYNVHVHVYAHCIYMKSTTGIYTKYSCTSTMHVHVASAGRRTNIPFNCMALLFNYAASGFHFLCKPEIKMCTGSCLHEAIGSACECVIVIALGPY